MDHFDQDVIIGDAASSVRQNVLVNNSPADHEFTINNKFDNSVTNENTVDVRKLEKCPTDRVVREMCNIVGTVEDRIENAILTAVDNIITLRIELAENALS